MTDKTRGVRAFATATAGMALLLLVAWVAFAAWRAPDFILTRFQGIAPLPPVYGFFLPRATPWMAAAGIVLGLLVGGAWWFAREPSRLRTTRRSTVFWVVCLVCFAFAFRLTVHAGRSGTLPGPELATYAGETVLFDAVEIESAAEFLDRYAEIQPSLSLHGRTKPPGFALVYHGLLKTVGPRLDVLGVLLTLVGSWIVWPTFSLARHLGQAGRAASGSAAGSEPETLAWGAAILVAVAPAAVLFGAVSLDAVFALVAATAFALLAGELVEPRVSRRLGLGVVLSGALLLSYSAFPVILLTGLALGIARRRELGRLGIHLGQIGAAVVVPQALLALATGFDPWRTFVQARRLNAASMTEIVGRDVTSWEVWLYVTPGNLLAFLLFLGPAVVAGLARLGPPIHAPSPPHVTRPLAAAFGLTLLTVSAGGLYLLETERILLFLIPPAVALAVRSRGFQVPLAVAVTGTLTLLFEGLLFTLK